MASSECFMTQLFSASNILIFVLSVLALWKLFNRRKYKLPPRPLSWPIVGNFFSIPNPKVQVLHKWCFDVAQKYGSVFRLTLGLFDAVVINDIDHAEEALLGKSLEFSGRMNFIMMQAIAGDNQEIVAGDTNDPMWKVKRKLFSSSVRAFTKGQRYERRVLEAFDYTKHILDEKADLGVSFDPGDYCEFLIYNTMGSICFKRSFSEGDEDLGHIQHAMHSFNLSMGSPPTISDMLPFLKRLPFELPDMKWCRNAVRPMLEIFARELKKQRESYMPDNVETILHHMFKTIEESSEGDRMKELTEEEMKFLTVDVFSGSVDTSSTILRWIVCILAWNQDAQTKIYQEIDDVIGERDVSISQHKHLMPYSEAFILECFRFCTMGPFLIPRKTLVDTTIGEYDIPAETMVMTNAYAIHHDASNEDPYTFNVDRFITPEGKIGTRPRSFLPFGIGRRACPGETTGRSTAWTMMILLLQRYKILPPDGREMELKWSENFFLAESQPYDIKLETRNE